MASYLLVIGDRNALAWILESQKMAFSEARSRNAMKLQANDRLLIYATRGCFGNPARDRGRVIGEATVTSAVTDLSDPVTFNNRAFPVGCSLTFHRLAPAFTGVELSNFVRNMHAFPKPDAWSVYLRRTLLTLDDHDYGLLLEQLKEIAVAPSEVIPEYTALRRH